MNREQMNKFVINEKSTIVDAMQQIDINTRGIVYIVDEKYKLLGSLTDGDIRRWLIKTADLNGDILSIMNKTPKVICQKDVGRAQELIEKYMVNSIPVVNAKGILKDIILEEQEHGGKKQDNKLEDVPVIIMAGGKGTRLRPYTKILPKPLIPIGDIPIMERIIDRFCGFGMDTYYITVNYRKNMIRSYFNDLTPSYQIHYVEEDKPLGTAGSIQLIEEEFDKPVFVTNCDILIDADYTDIYKYHVESGNMLTIVTALKNIVVPYGVINAKEDGVVLSMEEKPKLSYFVNTGMYVVNPEALKLIPEDTFYHMTDLSDELLRRNERVGMYPISEESFLDMGEFEEMRSMEAKLNIKAE